jgi:hypothetical protein
MAAKKQKLTLPSVSMAGYLIYVSDTRATAGRGVDERRPPVSSAMSLLSPSLWSMLYPADSDLVQWDRSVPLGCPCATQQNQVSPSLFRVLPHLFGRARMGCLVFLTSPIAISSCAMRVFSSTLPPTPAPPKALPPPPQSEEPRDEPPSNPSRISSSSLMELSEDLLPRSARATGVKQCQGNASPNHILPTLRVGLFPLV